jgi:hypothetical protein
MSLLANGPSGKGFPEGHNENILGRKEENTVTRRYMIPHEVVIPWALFIALTREMEVSLIGAHSGRVRQSPGAKSANVALSHLLQYCTFCDFHYRAARGADLYIEWRLTGDSVSCVRGVKQWVFEADENWGRARGSHEAEQA